MRKSIRSWLSLLTVCFMLAAYCTTAQAALQAVGPISPATTLPTWYQDTTLLALEPCLDTNGLCVLPPFDLTFTGPITTTGPISNANFPGEIFYFLADTSLKVNGDTAKLRLAMEASFLGGVFPNGGITFLRINLQKMAGLPPNSTYTVTHPYGSFTFTTDGAGVANGGGGPAAFRTEDMSAGLADLYFPAGMKAATKTNIGPFLKSAGGLVVDPVSGTSYLGNPAVSTTVTGSPTGNNFFRITGPNIGGLNINTVQTNLFTVSGKLAPPPGTPITVTSATYSQSATAGQVSVFATSAPTANLTVSGAGFPITTMLHDALNPGNFFASITITTLPEITALPGVPALVSVLNTLDSVLLPVPPPHTRALVDGVAISAAIYDPLTGFLTIKATSSDTLAPLPVLTVPALLPPANVFDAAGILRVSVPVPPASITVASSNGGSATAPVTIGVLAPPPVAADDSATTAANTAVIINVLANDTPITSLNPASILITSQTLANGSAVPNPNGTVTFTPSATFSVLGGTTIFTYTVADNLGQVSVSATLPAQTTVTVTVTPAIVKLNPVAGNGAANTVAGTPVTIPMLPNVATPLPAVIDPASIVILSAVGGTPVPSLALPGSVIFTPALGFTGAASFTYTISSLPIVTAPAIVPLPLISNVATVTINVTAVVVAPPLAVANPDVATTLAGISRIITVLANDTGFAAGPVTIVTQPVSSAVPPTTGTAVANLDGTVTFAAATAGTYTFTYNVKNAAVPAVVSNTATVTVSVTSAIADAVTVLQAQFTTSGAQWTVQGNTTNVSPVSKIVTIHIGGITGPILGTVATNAADGRWKFQLVKGANPVPDLSKTISVSLPSGASRLAFPVTVK